MSKPQELPYGSWLSPITSDLIVAQSISLQDVMFDGPDIYWIEGRPQEAGRCVLVRRTPDGQTVDVTPAPLSARTRVHEYGGAAVLVSGGIAYVSDFRDQRLYEIAAGAAPRPLTPAPENPQAPDRSLRYADGRLDPGRNRWIGVRQDHLRSLQEPENTIVAVDLDVGGPGLVLERGSDFYSNPRLSPDGRQLAWLTWHHPNMPWVGTELWVASFAPDGTLTGKTRIAGGNTESIFQPEWSPDGRLYFVSDRSGWWNLYRAEGGGTAKAVCPRQAEFGQPQWSFGASTYAFLSEREIVCTYTEGLGHLARLDVESGVLTRFPLPFTEYGSIRSSGAKVAFRAGSPTAARMVVLFDPQANTTSILRRSGGDDPAIQRYVSAAQPIKFPTASGREAFGLYYPPHNPDFAAPAGQLPPLVVKCHGGPTASASSTLDLRTQFWTSRGVAVVDVDYGGSTGYGREYRDRLHLAWGVVDVEDCAAAARYLAESGLADPARTVITGGSAGGFTTLACLTAEDDAIRKVFCAGASHYGVSDTEALARDTHKFESRYMDWLIAPYTGPDPEQQDRNRRTYRDRSPIHHAGRLSVPVAFFQGTEDKIVPPNQTEMMVEHLQKRGIPVEYLLFAGEQHGFRQAGNIKRALDAELYFYASLVFHVGLRF
jgi:dipeptidyl aminopeptidase/acylaminoacyl peptidase